MDTSSDFLSITQATVQQTGRIIFQELDFTMRKGESWAILASTGAEKTAFLETILGRTSVTQGSIERPFASDYQEGQRQQGKVNSFRDLIAYVSQSYTFRNKSNVQEFYYQQRFNSADSDNAATVIEYLNGIDTKREGPWNLPRVLDVLMLETLAHKSLIKLSNGETRRLAIAAALL